MKKYILAALCLISLRSLGFSTVTPNGEVGNSQEEFFPPTLTYGGDSQPPAIELKIGSILQFGPFGSTLDFSNAFISVVDSQNQFLPMQDGQGGTVTRFELKRLNSPIAEMNSYTTQSGHIQLPSPLPEGSQWYIWVMLTGSQAQDIDYKRFPIQGMSAQIQDPGNVNCSVESLHLQGSASGGILPYQTWKWYVRRAAPDGEDFPAPENPNEMNGPGETSQFDWTIPDLTEDTTFEFKLHVTDSVGQTAETKRTVFISAYPKAVINGSGSLCSGDKIDLTSTGSGPGTLTYQWSLSNGCEGVSLSSPTESATWFETSEDLDEVQNCQVKLKVTNQCQVSSETIKFVTVNPKPEPKIKVVQAAPEPPLELQEGNTWYYCSADGLTFSALGSQAFDGAEITAYSWSLVNITNPDHHFLVSTGGNIEFPVSTLPEQRYRLTLTISDSRGCSKSKYIYVVGRPPFNIAVSNVPAEACPGMQFTFQTDPSQDVEVSWRLYKRISVDPLRYETEASGGDLGNEVTMPSGQTENTVYRLIISAIHTETQCKDQEVKEILVKVPVARIGGAPAEICEDGTLMLDGTGSDGHTYEELEYEWASSCGGSFEPSTANNSVVSFTPPNVEVKQECSLSLVVKDSCQPQNSSPPSTVNVTVKPVPNVTVQPAAPPVICSGGTQEFTAVSQDPADVVALYTYSWTVCEVGPDQTEINCQPSVPGRVFAFSRAVSEEKQFVIRLMTSSEGCSKASPPVRITVKPGPPTPRSVTLTPEIVDPTNPIGVCPTGRLTINLNWPPGFNPQPGYQVFWSMRLQGSQDPFPAYQQGTIITAPAAAEITAYEVDIYIKYPGLDCQSGTQRAGFVVTPPKATILSKPQGETAFCALTQEKIQLMGHVSGIIASEMEPQWRVDCGQGGGGGLSSTNELVTDFLPPDAIDQDRVCTVYLKTIDSCGNASAEDSVSFRIKKRPIASLNGPENVCAGSSADYVATVQQGTGESPFNFSFMGPSGFFSTTGDSQATYSTFFAANIPPGTPLTVSASVSGANSCLIVPNTITKTVIVGAPGAEAGIQPLPSDPAPVCVGSPVTLRARVTGQNIQCAWSNPGFGPGDSDWFTCSEGDILEFDTVVPASLGPREAWGMTLSVKDSCGRVISAGVLASVSRKPDGGIWATFTPTPGIIKFSAKVVGVSPMTGQWKKTGDNFGPSFTITSNEEFSIDIPYSLSSPPFINLWVTGCNAIAILGYDPRNGINGTPPVALFQAPPNITQLPGENPNPFYIGPQNFANSFSASAAVKSASTELVRPIEVQISFGSEDLITQIAEDKVEVRLDRTVQANELPVLYYWQESREKWSPVSGQTNKKEHIKAQVREAGYYQVHMQAQATQFSFGEVYVFPNPAMSPKKPVLHVEVDPADEVTARIYDASNELVTEFRVDGNPSYVNSRPTYEKELLIDRPGVFSGVVTAIKSGYETIRKKFQFTVIK